MLFSVVIPLFNKSTYIGRCLDSIRDREVEIIVIDDCSSDGSREVVLGLADCRLRLISVEKNQGPAYCRNVGIKEAKGEFIVFLDADDYLEDGYFEAVRNAMKDYPDEVLFASNLCASDAVYRESKFWEGAILLPRFSYHEWALANKFLLSSSSAICLRKVLLEGFLFKDSMRFGEDPELWVRLSEKYSIVYIPSAHVIYDTSIENSVSKLHAGMYPKQLLDTVLSQINLEASSIVYAYYRALIYKIGVLGKIYGRDTQLDPKYLKHLKPPDKILFFSLLFVPKIILSSIYKAYRYFR